MTTALSTDLGRVLSTHLGQPVRIHGLRRLAGGASHETWSFDASGESGCHPLILRREFDHGLLETAVSVEHDLLTSLHASGAPVPRPWLCDPTGEHLGAPSLVMERVPGTDLRKHLASDGAQDLARLAASAVEAQIAIHAADAGAIESSAAAEVDRWAEAIEVTGRRVHPVLATALAWARRSVPDSYECCLVHGDFKANNVLVRPDGKLCVIDWEMAHRGDPVEDLAWTLLWRTPWDIAGRLHPGATWISAYTAGSGRTVEPARLRFWSVVALIKLWAIFLTGCAAEHPRPTLRLLGRAEPWLQAQTAALLIEAVTR